MTQDEKRIKLAEAGGWTSKKVPSDETVKAQGYDEFRHTWWTNPKGETPKPLPNYFNDLNAMHELVMSQPKEVRSRFRLELEWLIAPSTKPGKVSGIQLMNAENYDQWFHATAAQRAEALGLTLNLWK